MVEGRSHINRFGFAEIPDMAELVGRLDANALAATMQAIVDLVFGGDDDNEEFMESLSDAAQANFIVPLQMANNLLEADEYTPIELISAACTVRSCARPHFAEFPEELVTLLTKLPQ